jgi:hypothetical protein
MCVCVYIYIYIYIYIWTEKGFKCLINYVIIHYFDQLEEAKFKE